LKHEQRVAAMFLHNIHAPAHTLIDQFLLKARILPVHTVVPQKSITPNFARVTPQVTLSGDTCIKTRTV